MILSLDSLVSFVCWPLAAADVVVADAAVVACEAGPETSADFGGCNRRPLRATLLPPSKRSRTG